MSNIYYALSNLNHNGRKFARGDEVKGLDEAQAESLLRDEIISETEPVDDVEVEEEEKVDSGEGENAKPAAGGEDQPETGEPSIDGTAASSQGNELGPDETKDKPSGIMGIFGRKASTDAEVGDTEDQTKTDDVQTDEGESSPDSDISADM